VYIYGRNILLEILASGNREQLRRIFFAPASAEWIEHNVVARDASLPCSRVPPKTLEQLVGKNVPHQGVVMDIKEFPYVDFDRWLQQQEHLPASFAVVLDRVQDPHNLGAIIRTAFGSGASGLLLPQDHSAQITPAVVKVSTGTAFRLPMVRVVNLRRAIEQLKENGFWVYGAHAGGKPYGEIAFPAKTVLVLGNEGEGIRRLLLESCDELVSIPMYRELDSLNVSVSAGVLCFDVARKIFAREETQ